ncbi:hypothetical protein Leryth_004579 [Lithospermum erythrorhizon]|nr:hypothetical protein Leryth_004579 [Lithospermum erythrorhizon]
MLFTLFTYLADHSIWLDGQECAGLSKELQTLDRQAVVSNHSAALINEALELYQNQSANDLFKELRSTSSEFRSKLEKFRNSRAEEMHQKQLHGIYKQNGNAYNMMHTDGKQHGLFNSKMEELQQLLKGINSVD